MSDRNARHGNDRRNDRQRRSRVDSKNHRETVRRTCKKVFQYELDDLKDQLRATYSAEAKKSMNIAITAEEQKLIDDKLINKAVEERLRQMCDKFDQDVYQGSADPHTFTVLNFFYLVRLAQQGYFQLLGGEFPKVELQAVTYLCDKLIGLSLQSARAIDSNAENAYSTELTHLLNKLHFGDKEAVAEGFTTTFGNIKGAINGLAKQSFRDGNNAEQTETQKLSRASNGQLAQPPVWIVMPYISMIDGGYSNMSGLINSLSAQLPQPFTQNSLIPPQIVSIGKKEPESRQEPVQQEQVVENKEENEQQVINEEDKKEDVVNEEAAIQEESVQVESAIQEEPVKEESVIQEALAKEESVIQEAPVKEEEPPMNEERPETPHADDETVEDERFADADPDEIGDIPIRSSPFDCFSDLDSDGLSIPKENTAVPNSPASTSFSNLANDDTKTPTQSSTESKPNAEDMASAGWKNFRAPDQTNRKSNTSAKKSQRRRSQR